MLECQPIVEDDKTSREPPSGWRRAGKDESPWRRIGEWVASIKPAKAYGRPKPGKVVLILCHEYDTVEDAAAAGNMALEMLRRAA